VQTGRSIEARTKQHQRYVRLKQPDKSAVAQHSINLGHSIKLQYTAILCTNMTYMDRMIREATEIDLHQEDMKKEDGPRLSRAW
jgi:hypothetical protein